MTLERFDNTGTEQSSE